MKTKITKSFIYVFLPIFSFFSCVENELLEVEDPKDDDKALEVDFASREFIDNLKLPKVTFSELEFQEPDYDSLFKFDFSTEAAQEFLGAVENSTGNVNAWTLLQQNLASSSPEIKFYFENADEKTLKTLINPTREIEEGLEDFFRDLFSNESMGLVLPSLPEPYKRQEHNTDWSKPKNNNLRQMEEHEGLINLANCLEEVSFNRGRLARGLFFVKDDVVGEIYGQFSPALGAVGDRYEKRRELIDLLYEERVGIIEVLIEHALKLACEAGFHDTAALKNQIYQLGVVYAYYIRTQMEVWYETARQLNDILYDREFQMVLDERQVKLDALEAVYREKIDFLNAWEEDAKEECALTGSFTFLDVYEFYRFDEDLS